MPVPQDQEVVDPKHPVSVLHHDSEVHDYPTVPLYNRKDNFSRFDLETLFFAFYYQQGTHQQHMAAVELKKEKLEVQQEVCDVVQKGGRTIRIWLAGVAFRSFPRTPTKYTSNRATKRVADGKRLRKVCLLRL